MILTWAKGYSLGQKRYSLEQEGYSLGQEDAGHDEGGVDCGETVGPDAVLLVERGLQVGHGLEGREEEHEGRAHHQHVLVDLPGERGT